MITNKQKPDKLLQLITICFQYSINFYRNKLIYLSLKLTKQFFRLNESLRFFGCEHREKKKVANKALTINNRFTSLWKLMLREKIKNCSVDNINAIYEWMRQRIFNWLLVDVDPRVFMKNVNEKNAHVIYVLYIESHWSEILAGSIKSTQKNRMSHAQNAFTRFPFFSLDEKSS